MRIVALLLCVLTTACTRQARANIETSLALRLISEKEQRAIGQEVHAELQRQGVRYVDDPVVVAYVRGIVDDVAKVVERKKALSNLHVHVIADNSVVNAFATPGGHVFVYSGLLRAARDEAEVAGVLAHEVGHLAARHPARRMLWVFGVATVEQVALGKDPEVLEQIAASLLTGGVLAANSRADEREADDLAVLYLHRAGWDPLGMVRFFRVLAKDEPRVPPPLSWLSTHPTSGERIEELRAFINQKGWEGGEEGADRHAEIRARLTPRGPSTK